MDINKLIEQYERKALTQQATLQATLEELELVANEPQAAKAVPMLRSKRDRQNNALNATRAYIDFLKTSRPKKR